MNINKIIFAVGVALMFETVGVSVYADEAMENTMWTEEITNNTAINLMKKNYSVKVAAENNEGLFCDVNAFEISGTFYAVLPYNCDFSCVTFDIYEDSEKVYTETFDYLENDVKSMKMGNRPLNIKVISSELPVMYINIDEEYGKISDMNASEDHSVYCYGDMHMDVPEFWVEKLGCESTYDTSENDGKPDIPGTVRMRGRGNSTWTTVTDKQRPYQLKLDTGLDLLGMGKNKDWALLRSETHLKYFCNKISYDMARDFNVPYTPRCEMVDVILNGKYIGMYTLSSTVKVGKNSLPITDIDDIIEKNGYDEDTDITGGYLMEIDNFANKNQFTAKNNKITIKSPENLEKEDYGYIKDIMTDLFNAVYGDGYLSDGRHFTEVLDMDSTVRYLLHQELIGNYDCCQGSTFFYKDRDSIDPKIYMGPVWDCEFAFEMYGNEWCLPHRLTYWDPHPLFVNALCKHKEFTDYLCAYYYDNMNNNNIRKIYSDYANRIVDYEKLYKKAASMTSILYRIDEPNVSYITSYIVGKSRFMDENLLNLKYESNKGNDIEIFTKIGYDDNDNGCCDPIGYNGKLNCTYNNTKEESKDILIMQYDMSSKLIDVKCIKDCKPNFKTYISVEFNNIGNSFFKITDGDDIVSFKRNHSIIQPYGYSPSSKGFMRPLPNTNPEIDTSKDINIEDVRNIKGKVFGVDVNQGFFY